FHGPHPGMGSPHWPPEHRLCGLCFAAPTPWHAYGGGGSTRPRFRWRDHGRDNLVERGVSDLLHSQCRVGHWLYRHRPVANEALDRVRPADRLYRLSVAPGAVLRAMRLLVEDAQA